MMYVTFTDVLQGKYTPEKSFCTNEGLGFVFGKKYKRSTIDTELIRITVSGKTGRGKKSAQISVPVSLLEEDLPKIVSTLRNMWILSIRPC